MQTQFYIHSEINNTPVTGRGSCYCDLLALIETDCDSIQEAKELAQVLSHIVKHAYTVTYHLPEHDNQNRRHGVVYK